MLVTGPVGFAARLSSWHCSAMNHSVCFGSEAAAMDSGSSSAYESEPSDSETLGSLDTEGTTFYIHPDTPRPLSENGSNPTSEVQSFETKPKSELAYQLHAMAWVGDLVLATAWVPGHVASGVWHPLIYVQGLTLSGHELAPPDSDLAGWYIAVYVPDRHQPVVPDLLNGVWLDLY